MVLSNSRNHTLDNMRSSMRDNCKEMKSLVTGSLVINRINLELPKQLLKYLSKHRNLLLKYNKRFKFKQNQSRLSMTNHLVVKTKALIRTMMISHLNFGLGASPNLKLNTLCLSISFLSTLTRKSKAMEMIQLENSSLKARN